MVPTIEVSETRLRAIAQGIDADIDLAEAALLIARQEYPDIDIRAYLARLDTLAETAEAMCEGETLADRIDGLNRCLFEREGFRGNAQDYYDPRNSFLNEVLDRKLGIPITLSVIYLEIGRRMGLPFEGVAFPGHFLVRLAVPDGLIVIDPFHAGAALDEEEIERRRARAPASVHGLSMAELLAPASKRDVLTRMLRNLKHVYVQRQDYHRAVGILNVILSLAPDALNDLRERARLYEALESYRAAQADYEHYLLRAPAMPDAAEVLERLAAMRRFTARLH